MEPARKRLMVSRRSTFSSIATVLWPDMLCSGVVYFSEVIYEL